jgi:alkylation response protein AidB-like acyl-CoA dehydrogenase
MLLRSHGTMPGLDRETLDLVLEQFKEFAARELTDPKLLELDKEDRFPEDLVRQMGGGGLGIQLLFVPEEYGGMGGGVIDVYRICEAMAHVDVGIATGVLATFLGSDPIVYGGTAEQKRRWLGRIAEEGILMAYGATEPQAGSDLGALRTVAERLEEGGALKGYAITGSKQWISNGGFADVYTVLANAPAGPTWFVVDRGTEGFSHGNPEDKHGIRASNTAALSLDRVFVEPDRVVGGIEGQGLVQAQMVFGYTRLMVAAFGLGAGWAALDRAIAYSKERIQAGGPLSEKQGYTHKLIVPHAARLEAGRAFIEETARRLDSGEGNLNTEGAIAKYLSTEAGNQAADAAIQALGGYGYTREYMVEKIRRDVRITTIYEGTSEIMEMTISRDRWQQHIKTHGQHYRDQARRMERQEIDFPGTGASFAALALNALAEVLESARTARLTRQQHVLFRLGELMALAEGARALAERARLFAQGEQGPKASPRFAAPAVAMVSRIYGREAALRVAQDGLRWAAGAGGDAAALARGLKLEQIYGTQSGLLADMDQLADVLYGRSG